MRSILEQLHDDQALLLMYLADELPAADRQLVDQRLSRDPKLQAELERLRAAHETVTQELGQLDRAQVMANHEPGLRQVNRLIRQWQIDQTRHAATAVPHRSGWASWWLYPGAAAVAAVVIYTIWWGFQPAEPPTRTPAVASDVPVWGSEDSRSYARGYNPSDTSVLDAAEQELDQLAALRTMMQ